MFMPSLALFGLKMLKEGFEMRADEGMEELDEVQQELKQKDEERERQQGDAEAGPVRASDKLKKCVSPVFFQGILTFSPEVVIPFSPYNDIPRRVG